MDDTYITYTEDLSVPHLTGSYVVIDQFGGVTHEPIAWEYLGNGVYCEQEAYYGLIQGETLVQSM